VVADSNEDTLTLIAGTGMTLTTDASTDSITFTNSDRGSSQNIFKTIKASGAEITANSNSTIFELVAGTNIQLEGNNTSKTVTVNAAHNLNAHTDVVITDPDSNDLLLFNGTN